MKVLNEPESLNSQFILGERLESHVGGSPSLNALRSRESGQSFLSCESQREELIVHDHVSVPTDLEHGQAVLNLTP